MLPINVDMKVTEFEDHFKHVKTFKLACACDSSDVYVRMFKAS